MAERRSASVERSRPCARASRSAAGAACSVSGNAVTPPVAVGRLAQPGLTFPRVFRNARAIAPAQPSGSLSAGSAPAPRTRTYLPEGRSPATVRSVALGACTACSPASTSAGAVASVAPSGSTGSGVAGCGLPLQAASPSARSQVGPVNGPPSTVAAGAGGASSWQELARACAAWRAAGGAASATSRASGSASPASAAVAAAGSWASACAPARTVRRASTSSSIRPCTCRGCVRRRAARRVTAAAPGPSAFASARASARPSPPKSAALGPPSSTSARTRSP